MAKPITTCLVADNLADTKSRRKITAGPDTIAGWIITRPNWPAGLFSLFGCEGGIAHMIGYVDDPTYIIPALQAWHQERSAARDYGPEEGA